MSLSLDASGSSIFGQGSEYPPEVWESNRPEIERLYIVENLELDQVMAVMGESGFFATKKQYKIWITKWELPKNPKKDALLLARKLLKLRIEDDKETKFRMDEKLVSVEKINWKSRVPKDSLASYGSSKPFKILWGRSDGSGAAAPSTTDNRTPRKQAAESVLAQPSTDTILRQAVFSPWHEQSIAAATKTEEIEHLSRSYEEAIQLTDQQPDKLILNLCCQFWLAKVYAYKIGREEAALHLWESIKDSCDRAWNVVLDNDGSLNRLHLLTLEELSLRGIIKDASVAIDKIATGDNLFLLTRKLILIGKAMERRNLNIYARGIYTKIVRRCLAFEGDNSIPELFRCLGNALVALGEYEDAQYAFRVSITLGALCDSCIAISGSPALVESIRGSRFKCLSCAEIDLCEKCFMARKQGAASAIPRGCSQEHGFMRIPCLGVDPDRSAEALGPIYKTLRQWLYELCTKYEVDLPWRGNV